MPVDVVKERLQVQAVQAAECSANTAAAAANSTAGKAPPTGASSATASFTPYRSSWDALTTIARTEGVLGGLYRGFGVTLFSFGPFSALYFLLYEQVGG